MDLYSMLMVGPSNMAAAIGFTHAQQMRYPLFHISLNQTG
jgi:hypothetical protein